MIQAMKEYTGMIWRDKKNRKIGLLWAVYVIYVFTVAAWPGEGLGDFGLKIVLIAIGMLIHIAVVLPFAMWYKYHYEEKEKA